MEQIYVFTLGVLFILAIFDLTVGVANDAVNFMASAVGSRVASIRTILTVASVGVWLGAVFSSGMMDIAKKGIFNPEMFLFEEIMIIFCTVMVTDIILLDMFNYLGLPTSTTISVVMSLIGGSVAVAVLKSFGGDEHAILDYINANKVVQIVVGILLSVVIAFSVGSVVQYITRIIFTFRYEGKMQYLSGVFGGLSLTALSYFLILKGLKGTALLSSEQLEWINTNTFTIIGSLFVGLSLVSHLLYLSGVSILKVIILSGTFALAMAFAGNDLVNFIGVPIAALESHSLWSNAGSPVRSFTMEGLRNSSQTSQLLLIGAGVIMVLTLWFSKKAHNVLQTQLKLSSSQSDNSEQFNANAVSRSVVRFSVWVASIFDTVVPRWILNKIELRFQKPEENSTNAAAFDLVRAAVNLVVASSLIAMGTSLKLPLSTTYVVFMVSMGTSLADRAWGRESAVFRVAGVFNVIGGWFLTAGAAFTLSFVVSTLLFYGEIYALILMIVVVGMVLFGNSIAYKNKQKKEEAQAAKKRQFMENDLISINEIMKISSQNIAGAVGQINDLFTRVVDGLAVENHKDLKACKKESKALVKEIEDLKSEIYYFIKSLDDSSVASSKFYILILDYLHDMAKSMSFMAENSYVHTDNNHKKLKYNQIRNIKNIASQMQGQFQSILEILNTSVYATSITKLIGEQNLIKDQISILIENQILEIRSRESSPKNTKLYFSLLLETKVLNRSIINLMSLFKDFKDQYKRIKNQQESEETPSFKTAASSVVA